MELIFILPIIIFAAKIQYTQTRKCYVCGLEAPDPFKDIKDKMGKSMSVSSCDEFERSTNLDKFIVECPANYVGCITQMDDSIVTRTCDVLAINDCKTANGIQYCYCDTDLCNKQEERQPSHQRKFINLDTTDDEDMLDIESSGSSEIIDPDIGDDDRIEQSKSTTNSIQTTNHTAGIPITQKTQKSNSTINNRSTIVKMSEFMLLIQFLMQIITLLA